MFILRIPQKWFYKNIKYIMYLILNLVFIKLGPFFQIINVEIIILIIKIYKITIDPIIFSKPITVDLSSLLHKVQ